MPCGHGYQKKCDDCKTRQAFAQVVVEFDGEALLPSVQLNDCLGACGIADAVAVKRYGSGNLAAGECDAYKIKVTYDPCYFAVGLPPLVQSSTCAPNEHTYDAKVRQICDISNGQCAYFRVGLKEGPTTCYPVCAGSTAPQPAGVVAFNILAQQGTECQ